jgi:hypothetical protein
MAECCMVINFYTQLQRLSQLIVNFVHYTNKNEKSSIILGNLYKQ